MYDIKTGSYLHHVSEFLSYRSVLHIGIPQSVHKTFEHQPMNYSFSLALSHCVNGGGPYLVILDQMIKIHIQCA